MRIKDLIDGMNRTQLDIMVAVLSDMELYKAIKAIIHTPAHGKDYYIKYLYKAKKGLKWK